MNVIQYERKYARNDRLMTENGEKNDTEAILRKRGWSIHSSDRENSCSFEGADGDSEEHVDENDSCDEEGIESLFVASSSSDSMAMSSSENETEVTERRYAVDENLNRRKAQLSKWSLQFLDSMKAQQRRTIIEPPRIIPLNGIYLREFGKREREYDESIGRKVEIETSILDDASDDNGGKESDAEQRDQKARKKKMKTGGEGCKVKIINLKYTTTKDMIGKECSRFGDIVRVNIIMEKDDPDRSTGRAYVEFETTEAATTCAKELNETISSVDGRVWRVSLAASLTNKQDNAMKQSLLSQHWEQQQSYHFNEHHVDISLKCRRCLQVGHLEASCRNDETPKPCYICARVGDHDSRDCPMTCICFNCGVPGHAARNCPEARGSGGATRRPRVVCGICFASTHHRWKCDARSDRDICKQDAYCFVCNKKNHFSCKPCLWDESVYAMTGYSCFNCGQQGHHGGSCTRPNVEYCTRNHQIAFAEIERAESWVDDIKTGGKNTSEERGRLPARKTDGMMKTNNRSAAQDRARSLPPSREYRV